MVAFALRVLFRVMHNTPQQVGLHIKTVPQRTLKIIYTCYKNLSVNAFIHMPVGLKETQQYDRLGCSRSPTIYENLPVIVSLISVYSGTSE